MIAYLLDSLFGNPAVFAAFVSAVTLVVVLGVNAGYRYLAAPEPDKLRADRLESKVVDLETRLAHADKAHQTEFDEHLKTLEMLQSERKTFDQVSQQLDQVAGDLCNAENACRKLMDDYNQLAAEVHAGHWNLEYQAKLEDALRGAELARNNEEATRTVLTAELAEAHDAYETFRSEMEKQAVEWGMAVRIRDEQIEKLTNGKEFVEGVCAEFAERIDELEQQLVTVGEINDNHVETIQRLRETVKRQNDERGSFPAAPKFHVGQRIRYKLTGNEATISEVFWDAGQWCYRYAEKPGGVGAESIMEPATERPIKTGDLVTITSDGSLKAVSAGDTPVGLAWDPSTAGGITFTPVQEIRWDYQSN